jgi:hypothetical protein
MIYLSNLFRARGWKENQRRRKNLKFFLFAESIKIRRINPFRGHWVLRYPRDDVGDLYDRGYDECSDREASAG